MANVEFHTGFDGCGSTSDLLTFFDGNQYGASLDSSNGYNNSKCLKLDNVYSANCFITKNVTFAKTKSVSFHIKLKSYRDKYNFIFLGPEIELYFPGSSTGMEVRRDGILLSNSAGVAPPLNTLTHVEIKCYSHSSAGTIQVWLNGDEVINTSGLNTGGADITAIQFFNGNFSLSDVSFYIDDLVIADDWVGHSTVQKKSPNVDASVAFTPSTGADNYAMIDDDGQDGDSSYVDALVTSQDLYGYEDVDTGIEIVAVNLVTVAKKTGAGKYPVYLQSVAKQDAVEYLKSQRAIGMSYPATQGSGFFDAYPTAPDGSAWTPTIWNAIQFGFKATLTSP